MTLGIATNAYNPRAWFWTVENRTGLVFSAAEAAYIDPSDSAYQAWLADGNVASSILSDGELAEVLFRASCPASMIDAAGYTDWGGVTPEDRVVVLLALGLEIVSTTSPELNAVYALDDAARVRINSTVSYIATYNSFPNSASTFDWPDIEGNVVTFPSKQEFQAFGRAISDYVSSVHDWGFAGATAAPPAQPVTIS